MQSRTPASFNSRASPLCVNVLTPSLPRYRIEKHYKRLSEENTMPWLHFVPSKAYGDCMASPFIEGESLLLNLDLCGIACSSGGNQNRIGSNGFFQLDRRNDTVRTDRKIGYFVPLRRKLLASRHNGGMFDRACDNVFPRILFGMRYSLERPSTRKRVGRHCA